MAIARKVFAAAVCVLCILTLLAAKLVIPFQEMPRPKPFCVAVMSIVVANKDVTETEALTAVAPLPAPTVPSMVIIPVPAFMLRTISITLPPLPFELAVIVISLLLVVKTPAIRTAPLVLPTLVAVALIFMGVVPFVVIFRRISMA